MAKPVGPDSNPDLYFCKSCSELMEDPHLTDCCGYHFCKNCIDRQDAKQRVCPHCKGNPKVILPNRQLEAAINGCKIPCTHSDKGCSWTGLPSKLDKHLNKGELEGECEYQILCCCDCGNECPRKVIYKHKVEECCQRLTCCKHCGIKKFFSELEYHYLRCTGYPVGCPYECGNTTLKRRDKREHLLKCGEVKVKCPFGCEGNLKKKDLKMHLWKNKQYHHLLSQGGHKARKHKQASNSDYSDSEQEEFDRINRTPRRPRKHAKLDYETEDDDEEESTTGNEDDFAHSPTKSPLHSKAPSLIVHLSRKALPKLK